MSTISGAEIVQTMFVAHTFLISGVLSDFPGWGI